MRIGAGNGLGFETFGPTPIIFLLSVAPERQRDLLTSEIIRSDPPIPAPQESDVFGNIVTRVVAPGGRFNVSADFLIADTGRPDHFNREWVHYLGWRGAREPRISVRPRACH
jgi:hypothetical protein